jgi:hypothetical protein
MIKDINNLRRGMELLVDAAIFALNFREHETMEALGTVETRRLTG